MDEEIPGFTTKTRLVSPRRPAQLIEAKVGKLIPDFP